MTTSEIVMAVLNVLLVSGGLVVLVTLRSTVKSAKAAAPANGTDANDKLMKSYEEHILNPVLKELEVLRGERECSRENELKREKLYEKTNRKLDRLARAIEKIPSCPHAAQCPVSDSLQKSAADCPD